MRFCCRRSSGFWAYLLRKIVGNRKEQIRCTSLPGLLVSGLPVLHGAVRPPEISVVLVFAVAPPLSRLAVPGGDSGTWGKSSLLRAKEVIFVRIFGGIICFL